MPTTVQQSGASAGSAETGPGAPLVRVSDLHVSFERHGSTVKALRGVSLEIARGEILGIVGESGSGKSVLGLTLLGLLPTSPAPSLAGSAQVCGTDMVAAGAEARRDVRRRHLGAVFQDPMTSLNPTMRIGRQVAEAAGSEEGALRLLGAVGIPDPASRLRAWPHELSGGLRQRVMIAIALAGEPDLIVADEPTTALDVTVQAQILELLASLRRDSGTSVVLVTHDLGVAAQVADRIAVLYAGRLVEVGPSATILDDPRHPYTAGLLRSRLRLDTVRSRPLRTLAGEPPDPRDPPPGCAFAPRCPHRRDQCEASPPDMEPVEAVRAAACVRIGEIDVLSTTDEALDDWPVGARGARAGTALVVRDVHKTFTSGRGRRRRALQALRGVDLDIDEGEAVALVGESGCGKSTLLRSIAALQPVDSGVIDLARGGRPQLVFQDAGASLTPWLTVGELIGERLREEKLGRNARRARIEAGLKLVGLPAEVTAARPAQLSGGQRQRVALARATVVPPQVLLCDEPTSALDVSLAATVLNLIGTLRRELGMAVLFVTHDLAAARIVADRIAVMYLGRVIEQGPVEEVCASPVHPYTKALLGTVPGAGRFRVALRGEPASALDPPGGCEFHPRCPDALTSCTTAPAPLVELPGRAARAVACPVHAVEGV